MIPLDIFLPIQAPVNIWAVVVFALAPGVFWLWYFYHQDRMEPEPLSLVVRMYVLGMVATIIAFTLEGLIGGSVSAFLYGSVLAPVVEESVKFLMVFLFVYHNREFEGPMDGIVYSTATALGFASLENVLYLLAQPTLPILLVTGTIRAILSVPGHALYSVFWGYALGIAKFRPAGKRASVILGGLFLGIGFHGLSNYLLDTSYIGFTILMFLIVPCIWWIAEKRIREALLVGNLNGIDEKEGVGG
jgi:RsiW-degrading membrane proteinase PrsW (M82 family)